MDNPWTAESLSELKVSAGGGRADAKHTSCHLPIHRSGAKVQGITRVCVLALVESPVVVCAAATQENHEHELLLMAGGDRPRGSCWENR